MSGAGVAAGPRLLNPQTTAAVVLGAHEWTAAGLVRAPSFLRSARGIVAYLYNPAGLGLDPDLVIDLFDDTASAGEQLARIRDTLNVLLRERRDEGRPVADVLVYYVGHGHTDDQNHLSLLVRGSRRGMETETGIKAPDLARVLKVSAPQQRRIVVLDCCFSEAAAQSFIGQSGALDQAVAATAAKDLTDDQPQRGTLLLCSSPVGEVSMGPPGTRHTLFTGAVLDVLRQGVEGKPPALSFADLRDAAFHRMVVEFGANAPRPALHAVNQAQGDLSRLPAFPNYALVTTAVASKPVSLPKLTSQPEPLQAIVPPLAPPKPNSSSLPAKGDIQRPPRLAWKLLLTLTDLLLTLTIAAVFFGVVFSMALWGFGPPINTQPQVLNSPPTIQPPANSPPLTADENFRLGRQRRREGNDHEAVRLYQLAANQGDGRALNSLGIMHEQGRGGLAKNDHEAVRLYQLAANQGDASGQAHLGIMYEQGRGGLSRDLEEAVRHYQQAARAGEPSAQTSLRRLGRTW
jgi:hypothetical protein